MKQILLIKIAASIAGLGYLSSLIIEKKLTLTEIQFEIISMVTLYVISFIIYFLIEEES